MNHLIVISTPDFFHSEILLIHQLFQNGLTRLHLRKPNCSFAEMENFISEINAKYYPFVSLHSHLQLAEKYKLGGIHKTSYNFKEFSEKNNFFGRKTASTHTFEECEKELQYSDYVFLSPIFDSISKEKYCSTFKEEDLTKFLSSIKKKEKIVALGGVDKNNIEKLKTIGFENFALLGSIWKPFLETNNLSFFLKNFSVIQKKFNKEEEKKMMFNLLNIL